MIYVIYNTYRQYSTCMVLRNRKNRQNEYASTHFKRKLAVSFGSFCLQLTGIDANLSQIRSPFYGMREYKLCT